MRFLNETDGIARNTMILVGQKTLQWRLKFHRHLAVEIANAMNGK